MKTMGEILNQFGELNTCRCDDCVQKDYENLFKAAEVYAEQFKAKWIPISESYPIVGEKVLWFDSEFGGHSVFAIVKEKTVGKYWSYWMSIPKPPQP